MLKKIKKQRKAILLISLFFLFFAFNKALGRNLEISYPGSGFSTIATPINVYVRYIFGFLTTTVGVIALLFLILGGLNYLASAGNPEEVSKAKKRIFSALLGLLITLGSFLILFRIYSPFVILDDIITTPISPIVDQLQSQSPIIFCNQEINDINSILSTSTPPQAQLDIINNVKNHCVFAGTGPIINRVWRTPSVIYIFPGIKGTRYGAVFYSKDYKKAQVVYNVEEEGEEIEVKKITPMELPIFFSYPFTMVKSGFDSYDFSREVKMYKYHSQKNNPLNRQLEEDDEDEEALFYKRIRSTERKPLDYFHWYPPNRILGSIDINDKYGYIPKTITIFYIADTGEGPPRWDEGEYSEIAVFTGNYDNFNTTIMKKWGEESDPQCFEEDDEEERECSMCSWVWTSEGTGTPGFFYWNISGGICTSPCSTCGPPPVEDGEYEGEHAWVSCLPDDTPRCSWESTGTGWVINTDNCSPASHLKCPEPDDTGEVIDGYTWMTCVFDEIEITIMPCAGGKLIIAGEFGIFK